MPEFSHPRGGARYPRRMPTQIREALQASSEALHSGKLPGLRESHVESRARLRRGTHGAVSSLDLPGGGVLLALILTGLCQEGVQQLRALLLLVLMGAGGPHGGGDQAHQARDLDESPEPTVVPETPVANGCRLHALRWKAALDVGNDAASAKDRLQQHQKRSKGVHGKRPVLLDARLWRASGTAVVPPGQRPVDEDDERHLHDVREAVGRGGGARAQDSCYQSGDASVPYRPGQRQQYGQKHATPCAEADS
eukprot:CAMPEP_0171227298 /NCGR_PEP_ID=MMETSP0790-20130122/37770_1 /TAXON_ID=2925 /ORGANISM="Alexandrium catenella, Strain OF101" /LENGTH=251 /DNA_ID=CAMNT_0011693397 /DNA_START=10 /DNA_END=762 /DNA_ORIENTATION=-